jgi:hypothetical protein
MNRQRNFHAMRANHKADCLGRAIDRPWQPELKRRADIPVRSNRATFEEE